jgi:hypothetical protein
LVFGGYGMQMEMLSLLLQRGQKPSRCVCCVCRRRRCLPLQRGQQPSRPARCVCCVCHCCCESVGSEKSYGMPMEMLSLYQLYGRQPARCVGIILSWVTGYVFPVLAVNR